VFQGVLPLRSARFLASAEEMPGWPQIQQVRGPKPHDTSQEGQAIWPRGTPVTASVAFSGVAEQQAMLAMFPH
jgi:hypothetical protein